MPLLPTGVRRRPRDKALAASRRLSTGPEWEGHVRHELDVLAELRAYAFTFNPDGWLRRLG